MLFSLIKSILAGSKSTSQIDFITEAVRKMRPPSQMRVLDIEVTNKCDLACSNCTRLLENQDQYWDITLENFREAARSLRNFPGIIGIIGGNPCMHPKFAELCKILVEEIPEKERRGLWTNNFFKHRQLAENTFGAFNLNPHGKEDVITNVDSIKGIVWFHEGHSNHSPLLTAIKDLYPEEEMWKIIPTCDVNQFWSASIVQNKGVLKYYFCEVAASFDLARGEDHGLDLKNDWWKDPITAFEAQIRHFCPGCGIAAKIEGSFDHEETDFYTPSNAALALKGRKKSGKVIEIKTIDERNTLNRPVTEYSPWRQIVS